MHSRHAICFRSYGVCVRIESDDQELTKLGLAVANKALVGRIEIIDNETAAVDHTFGIYRDSNGLFFLNEGNQSGSIEDEESFRRLLNSMIRIHVAEKARGWLFIHAGVVGWQGKAIILPAMSHQGKTTLVSELLRAGTEYYSDEYAVIDSMGLVHPFERDLSVRMNGSEVPVDIPPQEFGSLAGKTPLPVGAVVLTKYEVGKVWKPETLSLGQGILETIPSAIAVNYSTEFSLKVLNTAFRRAIMVRSSRGEARETAYSILALFENNFKLANFT